MAIRRITRARSMLVGVGMGLGRRRWRGLGGGRRGCRWRRRDVLAEREAAGAELEPLERGGGLGGPVDPAPEDGLAGDLGRGLDQRDLVGRLDLTPLDALDFVAAGRGQQDVV